MQRDARHSSLVTLHPQRLRDVGVLMIAVSIVAGCHLLEKPLSLMRAKSRELPRLRTGADSISLEIVFVDRPSGDELLGTSLWSHVDQVASLDTATRSMLLQNGVRVGVLGTHPPESLQKMLGLKSMPTVHRGTGQDRSSGLEGRRVSIPSGSPTLIHVSPFYSPFAVEAEVTVEQGAEKRTRHYSNLRCLYKLTVKRLQDGWVQLDFLPQIYHGDPYLRPTAGIEAWELDHSQPVDTFHPQRFSLTLNEGEMAVVTAEENTRGTLGEQFFRERSSAATIQRVLLVRLCHSGTAAPVFGE